MYRQQGWIASVTVVVCLMVATDDNSSTMVQLTDEDKKLLERWQQMQKKHGVSNELLISSTVSAAGSEGNEGILTSTVCATTAGDSGALQLCSADSRLADQCLTNVHLVWSPLVRLSSADISDCIQASVASTHSTELPDAVATADNQDTLQQCCSGYGIGEIVPSVINKYVVSPVTCQLAVMPTR